MMKATILASVRRSRPSENFGRDSRTKSANEGMMDDNAQRLEELAKQLKRNARWSFVLAVLLTLAALANLLVLVRSCNFTPRTPRWHDPNAHYWRKP